MSNQIYRVVKQDESDKDCGSNIMTTSTVVNDSLLLLSVDDITTGINSSQNNSGSIFRSSHTRVAGNEDDDDKDNNDGILHHQHELQPSEEEQQHQQQRQRKLAVLLLFICVVLVFADQNVMAPNLSSIANYFHFNDIERDQKLGGDIALAFFVLGAPASFIIGTLADHYDRIYLFTGTIICGEGACFLTYFITTYRQLYVCRAVTGLSMGGILPLIYSLLGDMFTADERHSASSYVGIGMGIGISFGQGIAGFLGPIYGWRLPFLIVSIPAIICSLLLLCFVRDPERGGMEEVVRNIRSQNHEQEQQQQQQVDIREIEYDVAYTPPPLQGRNSDESSIEMSPLDTFDFRDNNDDSHFDRHHHHGIHSLTEQSALLSHWEQMKYQCSTIQKLLSTPTLLFALFQGAPGCVPWGIVNTYLNDYLSTNRNMTIQYATFVVLLFGIGNFFGMLVGGHGGGYLYRINVRYPAILAGFSSIAACIPFWILLNYVDAATNIVVVAFISISTGLFSGITGPIIKATVQNVTLPSTRGQAFALFNTFDDMGRGLGPVFVAKLIVQYNGSRTRAFNVGVFGWMVCGIVNVLVYCTVYNDERYIQSTIAQSLHHNTITVHGNDVI